ncbi:MAG TPA: extracellular solute-binding protein [Candidatus Binatia bacterium]|nr:extracellular solute-binding protein [Candidatus Binatia bacterium]
MKFLLASTWLLLFSAFNAASFAADSKTGWQHEWEKVVEAAKKEGQVTIYISGYDAILPDFQKAFPGIKVVAVTGRGSQIGQRIAAERRGEKHLADVVSAGANPNYQQFYRGKMLEPIKPTLILPEVLDQTKWYEGKHVYADPEGQYVFVYVGSATYGAINYNTKLVNPKEFKSYWDFLDPQWKGKIEARDVRRPGPGSGNMRFFYHHSEIGGEFIRRLFSEMELTLFEDPRQGSDWLATGKYAICFFLRRRHDEKAGTSGGHFRL